MTIDQPGATGVAEPDADVRCKVFNVDHSEGERCLTKLDDGRVLWAKLARGARVQLGIVMVGVLVQADGRTEDSMVPQYNIWFPHTPEVQWVTAAFESGAVTMAPLASAE